MANQRSLRSLIRYIRDFQALRPLSERLVPASVFTLHRVLNVSHINHILDNASNNPHCAVFSRHLSSSLTDDDDASEESEGEGVLEGSVGKSVLSAEDKENEAAEIGYKVIGQLQESDRLFKPYELVFAVVQIGSHQFKVSNGDCIYTERLKYCDINDKLILNKVLMLGSEAQTIIGRPMLPDAAVHAIVEEHALDAKVIVFKKKRRKNYRRTKGHRQELTKLRITDIHGISKGEERKTGKVNEASLKQKKEKPGKSAVAA